MKLASGKIQTPYRDMVYGLAGVGKTTFGAGAERPVLLCAEEGSDELDVVRLRRDDGEPLTGYADAQEAVRFLTEDDHDRSTLVIDTADWLHAWIEAHVCAKSNWSGIEAPGFGKGHTAVMEEWRRFVASLESLQRKRKMSIIVLAHAAPKRHSPPGGDQYDRVQPKMPDKVTALLMEWAKAVYYMQTEVLVHKDKEERRAKAAATGARHLVTEDTGAIVAKNRYGLPPILPVDGDVHKVLASYRSVRAEDDVAESIFEGMEPERQAVAREWWAKQTNKKTALQALMRKQ